MSTTLNDNLPEVLSSLSTRSLFVMRLDVRKLQNGGATPSGSRRIGVVPGGSFEGERLSGEVLDGGSDWQAVRTDGATTLNVRLVLKTKDEALISMTYRGIRYGPPDVMARIDKGEAVDPTSYYFSFVDSRHDIGDRKSTRLNSSHLGISYTVLCFGKRKSEM